MAIVDEAGRPCTTCGEVRQFYQRVLSANGSRADPFYLNSTPLINEYLTLLWSQLNSDQEAKRLFLSLMPDSNEVLLNQLLIDKLRNWHGLTLAQCDLALRRSTDPTVTIDPAIAEQIRGTEVTFAVPESIAPRLIGAVDNERSGRYDLALTCYEELGIQRKVDELRRRIEAHNKANGPTGPSGTATGLTPGDVVCPHCNNARPATDQQGASAPNFCSNCGKPYRAGQANDAISLSQEQRCPVCKNGRLTISRKLLKTEAACSNASCAARFMVKNDLMQLTDCSINRELLSRYPGPLRLSEWQNIANGGVSDAELYAIQQRQQQEEEERRRQERAVFLQKVADGNIDLLPPVTNLPPVVLRKGERCLLVAYNVQLFEDRMVRQYVGGSRGVSFRVMKGVSYRIGNHAGHSESHAEQRLIDTGTLFITTRRLIFTGTGRNSEVPLDKIITINPYRDAIDINRSGKQKTETYGNIDGIYTYAALAGAINATTDH